MSPLYSDLRLIADRLIREYGQPITIINPGPASGPPHDPVIGPPVTGTGFFVQVRDAQQLATNVRPLVQVDDVIGIVGADANIAPSTSSKFELRGQRYNAVSVQPLNPGGLTLLYEVVMRR